jgi:hypothetical protein
MKIIEFDIPSFYMPLEPYWIKELNLIVISTDRLVPPSDYYQPKFYTRVILYDFNPNTFKSILIDFVTFSNFLNQNYPLMWWLYRKTLSDPLKYQKEINDLEEYIKATYVKTDWHQTIDFNKYPLLELRQFPSEVCFKEYFINFHNLNGEIPFQSKLRNLIQFFAYNYLSYSILNRVYNNTNLQINNSFILIESLINLEGIDQTGFEICPNCQYKIPKKKKMLDLVQDFVKSKTDNITIQKVFNSILKEHYKVRNDFSHTAKYGSADKKIQEMLNKLGRNDFTLQDEIEHADASHQGLYFINSFIRIELLQKLDKINSSSKLGQESK